jgi:hypothetical protein
LADDPATCPAIRDIRPEGAERGKAKMSVILIQEFGIIVDKGRARPFQKVRRWLESDGRSFDYVFWRGRSRTDALATSCQI